MKIIVYSLFFLIALVFVAAMVVAFPDGSNFTGSTGAPGESSCSCHGSPNLGSGSASIIAQGNFMPGETVNLIARVRSGSAQRWGFAVTALDNNNQAVGDLNATDLVRTQKTVSNNRQYIKQTDDGTDFGTVDSTEWPFQWVAPASGVDQVTFYMSGLAADGNYMPNGDSAYTTSLSISRTGVEDANGNTLPGEYELSQNYPNPFNPSTTIEYSIPVRSYVTISIFNTLGQKLRTIVKDSETAGRHAVVWDGKDAYGNAVSSGIYLYQIKAGDFAEARKMLLLK